MSLKTPSPLWGDALSNMMRAPKSNPFPEVIGTFMARDALSLAAARLNFGSNDAVLLPAYLCREVLKPFLGKTRVEFYDVQLDLAVDPEEIRRKLKGKNVKAVLIINYFGFIQPHRTEIKQLISDRGIVLIEDCAHSLLTEGSGDVGDFCIYSFRKILPLTDGGGLKVNMAGENVNPEFYPKVYSNVLSVFAIAKSLLNVRSATLSRAGLSLGSEAAVPSTTSQGKSERFLPLSSFSYNGIGNSSFPEIIHRRRIDYQFWEELADETKLFSPVFSELYPGVCPMGCPVKAERRDVLMAALLMQGISAKIHWELPATIGKEFRNSHALSTMLITLPVYPELTKEGRERISLTLRSGI
jgi:dTDP-4-amino-4,6-dideoxygalactose transaminase